jgi:BirA family biotin operon repressor/biotin-[acetyl-CoA-carboxylase] ligase
VPRLGTAADGAGHRLEHIGEIGSTSASLSERARAGERGPLWLLADVQVAGRGRNARTWVSPPGNLYVSLLLTDPADPGHLPELSFVLSLALRDAVLDAAGLHEDPGLRLKWPNDLMVGGRKTAGLLLEGGAAAGTPFVVAGFGVNIVSHPEGTTHPATNLRAAGLMLARDGLLAALSDAVTRRLAQWSRGGRFAAIRADWLACAHGLGLPLRVTTARESFDGTFEGIDAAGRLLVATSAGTRALSAGEVFPLSVEGADAA